MSTGDSASRPLPKSPAEAARNVRDEARFGAAFLRIRWPRLLLASHVADTTSERFKKAQGAVGQ